MLPCLQIDAPEHVRPINSQAELHAMQAAMGVSQETAAMPGEHEILAGDLLHLRSQEVLTVPFAVQVFKGIEEAPVQLMHSTGHDCLNNTRFHVSPDAVKTVRLMLIDRNSGVQVLLPPAATIMM
jgi:hypothetical protein